MNSSRRKVAAAGERDWKRGEEAARRGSVNAASVRERAERRERLEKENPSTCSQTQTHTHSVLFTRSPVTSEANGREKFSAVLRETVIETTCSAGRRRSQSRVYVTVSLSLSPPVVLSNFPFNSHTHIDTWTDSTIAIHMKGEHK